VELLSSCHCRRHYAARAPGEKKKKALRSAGFQTCCVADFPVGGTSGGCTGSGFGNPRYSRLGSLRYFGFGDAALCPFAALASRKTTGTDANGGVRHPFYQRKRIICAGGFARIRRPAHGTGDDCRSAEKIPPIFGKTLDRKNLLPKFKRNANVTVKLET
jgi:hypothetical protein